MICLKHKRAAELLKVVQNKAEMDDLSAFSLDMWRSRTLGRHWSWGVAYVNDNVNFREIFSKNMDLNWFMPYRHIEVNSNLDWYFTYLKDYMQLKIETFYVENMYFIHWGSFFRNPLAATVFLWDNGKVIFPVMRYVFKNENLGNVKIADCLKINFNLSQNEGMYFIENEVPALKWSSPQIRLLNNMQDFCTREKSDENL